MMKWGGRKPSSSGPSHASPFSWLSKFKQLRMNSDPNPNKMKHKGKQNSTTVASSQPPPPPPPPLECSDRNNGGDRFYGGYDHDGAFLRQSFDHEESQGDKKSKDTYENVIPYSSKNAKKHGRRQDSLKLKEKDNNGLVEDERKLVSDDRKFEGYDREKEYENIRRRFERKAQQVLEEQLLKLEREASKAVEEEVLPFESPRNICTPRTHSFVSSAELKNSSLRNIIEDRVSQKKLISSERQNLKQSDQELNLKVKTHEEQKPSQLQRRKPKIKIYSPRMVSKVEVCRIKALEDMRKAAKLNKMKKDRREESTIPAGGDLDSFAVIKRSLDPRKDFRDSMIEMIMEKEISKAEEMEELLACYLTLNADEYHDLIIKVFRQVWFDMSQHGFGIKSDHMHWGCYHYE